MERGWKELFNYFGLSGLIKNVYYRLDWRKPHPESVKEFLKENIAMTQQLVQEGELPVFTGTRTNDQKMLKILRWVHDNIEYEKDIKRFPVVEKWQTVLETIEFGKGDCEDMSILIYCLANVNRINPAQVYLTTGWVKTDKGKAGHCWIEYIADEFFNINKPFTIDATYYYSPKKFEDRIRKSSNYLKDWWKTTVLW